MRRWELIYKLIGVLSNEELGKLIRQALQNRKFNTTYKNISGFKIILIKILEKI